MVVSISDIFELVISVVRNLGRILEAEVDQGTFFSDSHGDEEVLGMVKYLSEDEFPAEYEK